MFSIFETGSRELALLRRRRASLVKVQGALIPIMKGGGGGGGVQEEGKKIESFSFSSFSNSAFEFRRGVE